MQPVATEGNTESLCKAYPHSLWAAHEVQKGGQVSLAPAPRNWDTSSTERTALGHTAIAKTLELNVCVCVYTYTHIYIHIYTQEFKYVYMHLSLYLYVYTCLYISY